MYNIDSLRHGIESAKKNIATFEDAIIKEKETIKEYRFMIKHLEDKKAKSEELDAKKVKNDNKDGSNC